MTNETRIVFMGTPDFAVPTLRALATAYAVVGVVTQPDRPAGRGRQPRPSAVKQVARELGIPIFQPQTLRDEDAVERLRAWKPNVVVVAAFGQILKPDILNLAPSGSLNVHASLLPRWRGAAPINYAIWHGDEESGVTIMRMDVGLDTGPILAQRAIPLDPRETAATLHDKLADLGATTLLDALPGYLSGDVTPRPQPGEGVTLAPSLKKEEGQIDWEDPAAKIDRQVRAFDPWPGTYTFLGEKRVKILRGRATAYEKAYRWPPGTILRTPGEGMAVVTGEGQYSVEQIQMEGGKPIFAMDFLHGHAKEKGVRFT